MIRSIICDLDGVLVDAVELHRRSLNEALKELGFPEISMEDHVSRLNGLPTKDKLIILGYDPTEIYKINKEKQLRTILAIKETISPRPAIVSALQELSKIYTLGCASNSIKASLNEMLFRSGITPFFKVILSNEDVTRAKPDPEIYLKAAEALGVEPGECLVLEDALHGQKAAVAAGCKLCPIPSPASVTYEYILRYIRAHDGLTTSPKATAVPYPVLIHLTCSRCKWAPCQCHTWSAMWEPPTTLIITNETSD